MARLRIKTRRNPLKPIGALLINPGKRVKRKRNPPTSRAFAKPYSVKVSAADRQRAYRRRPAAKRKRSVAAFNYTAGRLVMPLAKFRKARKSRTRTRKNGKWMFARQVGTARNLRRSQGSLGLRKLAGSKARANPKRRRARARKNPLFLRTNGRKRTRRYARSRRNPFAARPRVRRMFRAAKARVGVRRARRNPLFMRTNPLFLRTNGRKRTKHRKHRRAARKNGFTLFRRNGSGMLAKIPVIGPALASMSTFLMPAAFGAVSVEPVMMAAQFAAPYLPAAMPFSATIALGGVAVGALIKAFAPKTGFISKEMANLLAVAAASGAGAIAYWTWRNGDDAPVAEKMGALIVAGYGSPFAAAIMGDAQLGALMLAQNPQYHGYGGFGGASAPAPTMNYAPAGGAAFL